MPYFYINQLLKRVAYTLSQVHSSIDPTSQLELFVSRLPRTSNIPKSTPSVQFSSIQFSSVSSVIQSRPTLCDPMDCSTPGFPVHHQLLELTQTEVHRGVMASNHLILCRPLFLPLSIFPSIRVCSNESVLCIRWPKYWSFSFSISPSNEYSGLISFRMDWLDLLAVQGTLKSLLQCHSSKASTALFMVQLSHPYMTTGQTIALTRKLVKVMLAK